MALTDTAIRNAKPGLKPKKIFDERGLFLLVQPSGGKLWRLKYRYLGKEKKLSLGIYPDVTLKVARERRDEARTLLANGADPASVKFDVEAAAKDVDGFHPVNVGRLSTGTGGLVPCTPLGVMKMLDTVFDDLTGKNVVVIGKSNIVGKPIAMLLLEREATVTVTHIETRGLPDIARQADIIVVAAGSPGLVRGFWVKEGAVLIDVGITRLPREAGDKRSGDRLVGDIAFDEVQHARAVTPVPGGVGPMTIACLLANTLKAARNMEGSDAFEVVAAG